MYRLKSSQTDRRIKQPNQPSQKQMLAPCFSCPIWLCALQPHVFKAAAGGDTHSSVPRLLYKTSPVYLTSAGITLTAHLSHAACWLNPSCVFLAQALHLHVCVCVNETGRVCYMENNCFCQCVYFCHRGFISTCEVTFMHECLIWHRKHFSLLADCILSDFLGSHIQKNWKGGCCLLWRSWDVNGRFQTLSYDFIYKKKRFIQFIYYSVVKVCCSWSVFQVKEVTILYK